MWQNINVVLGHYDGSAMNLYSFLIVLWFSILAYGSSVVALYQSLGWAWFSDGAFAPIN